MHPQVTEEEVAKLFSVCGVLKQVQLVHPLVTEVVFVKKDDAITTEKKCSNTYLHRKPIKCNLHMNENIITSNQPILPQLSDSPSVKSRASCLSW